MRLAVVQRILGMLLMLFSTSMLPPIVASLWYHDDSTNAFIYGFAVTLIAGALI